MLLATQARRRSGFGPVSAGYWVVVELSLAIVIIGIAVSLAVAEHSAARFKAAFAEALVLLPRAYADVVEQIALTGTWDAQDKQAAQPLAVDPQLSIDAAEQYLVQRGAMPAFGEGRTRLLRAGAGYVALVRYPAWEGTGVLSFRPAVPDVERPATVMWHCAPGSAPKGWVAPPVPVATNLPSSHQPSFCRGLP